MRMQRGEMRGSVFACSTPVLIRRRLAAERVERAGQLAVALQLNSHLSHAAWEQTTH